MYVCIYMYVCFNARVHVSVLSRGSCAAHCITTCAGTCIYMYMYMRTQYIHVHVHAYYIQAVRIQLMSYILDTFFAKWEMTCEHVYIHVHECGCIHVLFCKWE